MPSKTLKVAKCTDGNRVAAKTPAPNVDFGRLLTVADVCKELRVERRHVMALLRNGQLGWIDLNAGNGRKLVRIARRQLDEYLSSRVRLR